MSRRRSKGDGGLVQRHDHADCPPLEDTGRVDEKGRPILERPKHSCRGRWVGTLDVELPNGRTTRKYLYGRTKGDAKAKLDKALRDRNAGTLVATSPTLEAWLDTWMQARRRPPKPLKPNTWNGYAEKIRNYIVPTLGRKRLSDLRPQAIEAMYDDMRARGLAESTVRQTHAILTKSLKDALRKGLIGATPMDRVDPPGTETNDRAQWTHEEARLALKAAGDSARWWLAVFYGMRQGEALGLDWENVDWDAHVLSIKETWQQDYGGGARIKGTPKSKASKRILPMMPQIELRLRLLWEEQGRPATGPVFRNSRGTRLDPSADYKAWRKFNATAIVVPFLPPPRIALHAARNTAASLLEWAGVPDRLAAQILGHSDVRITHGYQTADIERMRLAFASAGRLLELE